MLWLLLCLACLSFWRDHGDARSGRFLRSLLTKLWVRESNEVHPADQSSAKVICQCKNSRILCAIAMFGFTMIAFAMTHGRGNTMADHLAFSGRYGLQNSITETQIT